MRPRKTTVSSGAGSVKRKADPLQENRTGAEMTLEKNGKSEYVMVNRQKKRSVRRGTCGKETHSAAAAAGGRIDCPLLMFVSDGKHVSAGWIENAKQFAMENSAETVFLDCGHYIHYYESEKISRKIREFTAGRTVK